MPPEGYWASITTLVVFAQPSLTQALSTARDQIVSACTGAAVDGLDVLAIQRGAVPIHVFTVALVQLAALAAARSGLRLACVTLHGPPRMMQTIRP
jgi:hypothetical protein